MQKRRVVIGLACGEESTVAFVSNLDKLALAEYTGGPSTVQRAGFQETVAQIHGSINAVCRSASIDFSQIEAIIISTPEYMDEGSHRSIEHALQQRWKRRKYRPRIIRVYNIAHLLLEARFPDSSAAIAVADDSAIVFARSGHGEIVHAGGWGPAIGDPGGGVSIGNSVLRHVANVYDGREHESKLFTAVADTYKISSPATFRHGLQTGRIRALDVVPIVLDAAQSREPTALSILNRGSLQFADMIRHVVTQLPMSRKIPLLLLGNLLVKDSPYYLLVKKKVTSTMPHVTITHIDFSVAQTAAEIGISLVRG
jgi:N-acetylglucosamine kinase-like BadF-type ATPase